MLRLTVFGGLRIEGEHGPLPGRASQRRRLALLALLASPPGHRTARDKLTASLWPDTSDERARRNLSSALYDLRAELGEDVVLATGDELALNPAVVASDLAVFVAALERGDLESATAAYAGPFLDGFFIDDADEFERWADGERQRYARDYRQALLQLAERHTAAADRRAAADAWHRLSVADPFSARIAVGYMTALDASGDRAGALRFARVHEALLREELGAEPSPEVATLAERLRAAPTASVAEQAAPPQDLPAAPGPAPAAPGPAPAAMPAATEEVAHRPDTIGGPVPAAAAERAPRWWVDRRVGVAAFLVVTLTVLGLLVTRGPVSPGAADPGIGVAVLPFQNLDGLPEMDPFCEGLAEDIIVGLGKVGSLRIPSRATMVSYQRRGVATAQLGQDLGVRYMLSGTVRREDARLRITAMLDDVHTGAVVWRDRYDLRMISVFDAQEEIAQAVVRAVAPHLAGGVGDLVLSTTRDTAAYRLYVKGRAHWYNRGPQDLFAALRNFQQALEQDPGYALAYAAVSDVHNLLGAYDYGLAPPASTFPVAREAAEQALRLNPELPEAHAALANVLFNYDWDLPAAEERYRRAIRLNPGYGMARHWLSLLLLAAGRPDEAYDEILTARQMDPRSPVLSTSVARHHYFAREFDRALREYEDAIDLDPSHLLAYLGAGLALVQLGEHDLALAHYQRAADMIGSPHPVTMALIGHANGLAGRRDQAEAVRRRLDELRAGGTYVPAHYLAIVAIGLGDLDVAMDRLMESLEERSASLLYAPIDPIVDPLRADPRFTRLLREAGERPLNGRRSAPTRPVG